MKAPNTATRSQPTSVFLSYSWDSEEHKNWVLDLVKRLRDHGVDAFNDETSLRLGGRSPEFMEKSVRDSGRVLVICTEKYKERFDHRRGGVGFEGHIISGEIVAEVGKNKFIPVLRSGDWQKSLPTALSGVYGLDLRNDSIEEFRKLVRDLHGATEMHPLGQPPDWLHQPTSSYAPTQIQDPTEYWDQRKRLPDTDISRKIWKKPRWRIWIRPTEFKKARFQNLERCRQFMVSSSVVVRGWYSYPYFSADSLEQGDEWVAAEVDHDDGRMARVERWALFRSGQFVHNRAIDEIKALGDRIHVLEILDTVTAAYEFAARMADQGVVSPEVAISLELSGIDGLELTWPKDVLGRVDRVRGNAYSQDETISVSRKLASDELKSKRREAALAVALEFFEKFGWHDPPEQELAQQQESRIG